jgi:hypothetical protein
MTAVSAKPQRDAFRRAIAQPTECVPRGRLTPPNAKLLRRGSADALNRSLARAAELFPIPRRKSKQNEAIFGAATNALPFKD